MTVNAVSNTSSPSTNWAYRKVKIDGHPQGTGTAPRRGTSKPRKRSWQWWRRGQVVIAYKGGQEASYVITFEGVTWRYPGHWCLHDVMTHLARVAR